MKKNLVVFCGARFPNLPPQELVEFKEQIQKFCTGLSKNYNLVYGGGNIGLMGLVADEFLKNKCNVTGIIPGYLNTVEILHEGITETQVVDDLHERKAMMEHLGDVFLVLPGGIGTLDELCEVLTLQTLHRHKKIICIWNWQNLFDGFLQFVETGVQRNFINADLISQCVISADYELILKKLL
ncbi:MAG: TIGR00730 family Rossman fold protein [Bdellovibrio sp.]|nr:TIGR00730 family Rossman fold protein [Bdellovibrio sp.]